MHNIQPYGYTIFYLTNPLFFEIWEVVSVSRNYGWFRYFVLMFLFAPVWFDIILIIKSNFKAS